MSTKYHYFKGTAKWAKVHKPDEKYGNYEIDVYLDNEQIKKFEETGIRVNKRNDADGVFVRFRRPMTKLIKGEAKEMGPPKVIDADGTTPFTKDIGNGSEVYCQVSSYPTAKGVGHTLLAVQVLKHVEFNGSGGGDAAFAPFSQE